MLQTISQFNKLPLAALVVLLAATFNSPKVDARNSQNLNQTQLPTSSAICTQRSTECIAAAPEWKTFSPDEGKSSILMPGEEISDMTPDKSEMHEGIESKKMYMSVYQENVFMVGYADIKNDLIPFHFKVDTNRQAGEQGAGSRGKELKTHHLYQVFREMV